MAWLAHSFILLLGQEAESSLFRDFTGWGGLPLLILSFSLISLPLSAPQFSGF